MRGRVISFHSAAFLFFGDLVDLFWYNCRKIVVVMLESIENTIVFKDSDSVCLGSNPSPAAIVKPLEIIAFQGVLLFLCYLS